MTRRLMALVAALALALGPLTGAGLAQQVQGVDVRGLEKELRCPTCNTPLDVSTAPIAIRMKDFIREKAEAGWTEERIKDALVAEFGREVLATPPKEGFDLVAWVVPGVAVALGLAAIPFLTRAWARRRPAAAAVEASPEELARLERELRDIDA